MGQLSAAQLPPVVQSGPSVSSTQVPAVIDSVDDPNNPQIVAVVINNELPPWPGFAWGQALGGYKFQEAPTTPTPPPSGIVYYNNRQTLTGGTIVYVDTVGRNVTTVTDNVDTVIPFNYSTWFQFIKHTGAFNGTQGFQQPAPIDWSQLKGNPTPSVGPVVSNVGTLTYPVVGNGTYQAEVSFTVDELDPSWLWGIRLFAVPAGSAPPDPNTVGTNYGDVPVINTGVYQNLIWDQFGGGTAYDLYCAYIDLKGGISVASNKIATTDPNPVGSSGFARLDPTVIPNPVARADAFLYESVGSGAYDATGTIYLDVNGTTANNALAEIEAVRAPASSNPAPDSQNWSPCGVPKVKNSSGVYTITWSSLGAGTQYVCGVRFVDHAGDRTEVYIVGTTQANPITVGLPNLDNMPPAIKQQGPDITSCVVTAPTAPAGSAGLFAIDVTFGDWVAGNVPTWGDYIVLYFRNPTTQGLVGEPTYFSFNDQNGNNVRVFDVTIPVGVVVDVGFAYEDLAGNISATVWPVQAGSLTPPLQNPNTTVAGSQYTNMIVDSDMLATNGGYGSAYWTYAGLDPTRFHVFYQPNSLFNTLAADAHGGAAVGPVCGYTEPMNVTAGQVYTLSVYANLDETQGGTMDFAVVDLADKNANATVPSHVYESQSIASTHPNNFPLKLYQVQWTATFTGQICGAFYGNGIHGSFNFGHPQFEIGSSATAYKSGPTTLTNAGTQAYGAAPSQVQNAVTPTGGVNLSASEGNLPMGNNSTSVVNTYGGGSSSGGTTGLDNIPPGAVYQPVVVNTQSGSNLITNGMFLEGLLDSAGGDFTWGWDNYLQQGPWTIARELGLLGVGADVLFRVNTGQTISAGQTYYCSIRTHESFPVVAGQAFYLAYVNRVDANGSLPAGINFASYCFLYVTFSDGSTGSYSPPGITSPNGGWEVAQIIATIPSSSPNGSGANPVSAQVYVWGYISNTTGSDFNTGSVLYVDARTGYVVLNRTPDYDNELKDGVDFARVDANTLLNNVVAAIQSRSFGIVPTDPLFDVTSDQGGFGALVTDPNGGVIGNLPYSNNGSPIISAINGNGALSAGDGSFAHFDETGTSASVNLGPGNWLVTCSVSVTIPGGHNGTCYLSVISTSGISSSTGAGYAENFTPNDVSVYFEQSIICPGNTTVTAGVTPSDNTIGEAGAVKIWAVRPSSIN